MSHAWVGMPGLRCASDGHGTQNDFLELRKCSQLKQLILIRVSSVATC
jgi:hypothetical protein